MTKAAGYGWSLPDGSPGPLEATEFSHGFVIYAVKPWVDTSRPPEAGGCLVIDKADGRIGGWPSYPVEIIAEQYVRGR